MSYYIEQLLKVNCYAYNLKHSYKLKLSPDYNTLAS